ncbi:MAG: adenylate/guanylate cyclase domain-containing protein [Verrucomicrobiota bacterium]
MPDPKNNTPDWRDALRRELRGKARGIVGGVVLSAGIGLVLLTTGLGDGLVTKSYDLPFAFRPIIQPQGVVMVYLDDASHAHLNQKYLEPWNRAYYTRLLKRLTADHAAAVVFDVVFSDAMDPAVDQQFADAIQENGKVILAADWNIKEYGVAGQAVGKQLIMPYEKFNAVAADVGADTLFPDAGEYIRRYKPTIPNEKNPDEKIPSEAWVTAVLVNPSFNESNALKWNSFWINYYSPEASLPSLSFYKAIADHDPDVPPGYFSHKVVFVGAKIQTFLQGERKDEYSTPFSYLPENKWAAGVTVHAIAFLNLIRGDYLRRPYYLLERTMIITLGILFGAMFVLIRPVMATFIALLSAMPVAFADYYMFQWHYTWFPWLIVVVGQIPIALVWGVAFNSLQLYAEKVRIEQSLSLYLSPKLVRKFARDPKLLRPGAEKQLLTILFTDIAGFTSISEGMDPDELARLMNDYFQTAVHNCIHATDGTVVKYIGDAIFAFWNAPDQQSDHAYLACDAALRFCALKPHQANGRDLITRLGLHTGVANVGNFGSDTRVDYTAIGENINLASRMEGLNKYTGTRVLLTGETQKEIGSRLVTRYLGLFRLKGFEKAVAVYELVGRPEQDADSGPLRECFAQALEKFGQRDFAAAADGFRRALEISPDDGPARFYLEQIEELRAGQLPPDWKGEITLKDK